MFTFLLVVLSLLFITGCQLVYDFRGWIRGTIDYDTHLLGHSRPIGITEEEWGLLLRWHCQQVLRQKVCGLVLVGLRVTLSLEQKVQLLLLRTFTFVN